MVMALESVNAVPLGCSGGGWSCDATGNDGSSKIVQL